MNSDWSASIKMEVMFAVLLLFSEGFALHSQRRHADIALMILMSRPWVDHSKSGL